MKPTLRQTCGTGRPHVTGGSPPAGVQQALREGLLDELIVHLVPLLLGGGVRLLDRVEGTLRCTGVVDAPGVTHLAYDVIR
jgi:riboflavin biosynthesis pyrimidine reductase